MAEEQQKSTFLGMLGRLLLWVLGIAASTLIGLIVTNHHMTVYRWFFPEPVKLVIQAEALDAVAADLEKAAEEDRPHRRYLLLAHLFVKGGTDEERAKARVAAQEAAAWLSPKGEAVSVEPLGPHGSVLRIDISQLGWEGRKQWHALLENDPYALDFFNSADAKLKAAAARVHKHQKDAPYVRADWFAARVTQPPLAKALTEKKAAREVPTSLTRFSQEYADGQIDAARLAAEMGVNIADMTAKIRQEKVLKSITQELAPLASDKTITRSALESRRFGSSPYQDLAQALKLGTPN